MEARVKVYILTSVLVTVLSLYFAISLYSKSRTEDCVPKEHARYKGLMSLIMVEREKDFSIAEISQLPEWFLNQLIQTKIDSVYADKFYITKITVPERIKKRLKISFVDLNQDEFPEVILNYTGFNECGNKACPSEIYTIDIKDKKLKKIGTVTESSYYILNAQDKNFEYVSSEYFKEHKVIVDCTYDYGEFALLVYSDKQHQYQRLKLVNEDELDSPYRFNDGCRSVTQKSLMISGEVIRKILDKHNALR